MLFLASVPLLAAIAQAAPALTSKTFTETFDDWQVIGPTIHNGLQWGDDNSQWQLGTGTAQLTAVTSPNVNQLFNAGGLRATGIIDANYVNSTTASFDLVQFYGGCTTKVLLWQGPFPLESTYDMAVACNITATAYYKDVGQMTGYSARTVLQFKPVSAINQPMTLFTLPASFKGLRRVEFTTSDIAKPAIGSTQSWFSTYDNMMLTSYTK